MPYVQVHVDADDVLEELSAEQLREELARRGRKSGRSGHYADYCIPQKVAECTLDEAAQIFRKQGRVDLAFKLDEIRVDYVE